LIVQDEENESRYTIVALSITGDGRYLITAGSRHVTLWRLFDLSIVSKLPVCIVMALVFIFEWLIVCDVCREKRPSSSLRNAGFCFVGHS
jgi:hypothetical protein